MTKTYYLTGHNPERYNDLLAPLIELRINDMSELLDELRVKARGIESGTIEYDAIVERYQEIEKGIKWWLELEYEGDIIYGTC